VQIFLKKSNINTDSYLIITGSKSESNRCLLLKALFNDITIENLSNSDDTELMKNALSSNHSLIDIHHAGTAMRFLTAYFATQNGRKTILTGSSRMKERPIRILVDALRNLGAKIEYSENEGFPPLKIQGQEFLKSEVFLQANVSSQYISALLLIAPSLKNGLNLYLDGKITSIPYIEMTLALLNEVGIKTSFESNKIKVFPYKGKNSKTLIVESDWSSASYFYSIVSLSSIGTKINISSYNKNSLQGDAILSKIYNSLGVSSKFNNSVLTIEKVSDDLPKSLDLDLSNTPDIAQTIAVSCLGLQINCNLTGLHTLKIKETDRLLALKNEIKKLGTNIEISNNSLEINSPKPLLKNVEIKTYNDHRMAMSFAPLMLRTNIFINDANVVSKSYPNFWNDLEKLGLNLAIQK
jgi:3-phosphoshikimate 1-carboxyvinyltransferase|tara:strand:+ start:759 stop:1988 length:1230 start_codon:yes stop_codon:yes gene_type:complete